MKLKLVTPAHHRPARRSPILIKPRFYVRETCEYLVLLICAYVFLIGPLYWTWYQAKYLNGNYLVALIYEPLWWLAWLLPPFGDWLNWYVKWWNL